MPPKKRNADKEEDEQITPKKTKKEASPAEREHVLRDPIVPKSEEEYESNAIYMKIVSWNVNGLRAVLRNHINLIPNLINVIIIISAFCMT